MIKMLNSIYETSQSRGFWLISLVFLFMMEIVALTYQYSLGEEPCALCVQIRAWIAGGLLINIFIMKFAKIFWLRFVGIISYTGLMAGGLYTSWHAWNVEEGKILSSCGFDSGFPEWLSLDKWLPLVFEAKGLCGQSPELLMGYTMTDGLIPALGIPVAISSIFILLHLLNMIKPSSIRR
jgi:disulfide bond formation protein DsbB